MPFFDVVHSAKLPDLSASEPNGLTGARFAPRLMYFFSLPKAQSHRRENARDSAHREAPNPPSVAFSFWAVGGRPRQHFTARRRSTHGNGISKRHPPATAACAPLAAGGVFSPPFPLTGARSENFHRTRREPTEMAFPHSPTRHSTRMCPPSAGRSPPPPFCPQSP